MTDPAHARLPSGLIYIAFVIALAAGFFYANQGTFLLLRPSAFVASVSTIGDSLRILIPLWLAAAGFGWPFRLLIGDATQHPRIIQTGAGLAVLLLMDMVFGALGVLDTNNAWILCANGISLLLCQIALHTSRQKKAISFIAPNPPLGAVLAAPLVGLILVAATCPPSTLWSVEAFGYDVLSYHLQLPREWLDEGRITGLTHNVYSYLPNLVEAGYMQIGAMRGGTMYEGIYAAQIFHASCAIFAAVAVSALVRSRTGSQAAAAIAAAAFLCVPWVTVTGSQAYDEAVVLALGATAFLVAFERGRSIDTAGATSAGTLPGPGRRLGGALLIGLLIGAATLAKLPAGPMIALPLVLALLFALNKDRDETPLPPYYASDAKTGSPAARLVGAVRRAERVRWLSHPVALAAAASIAAALTISPYLVRNYAWTKNPLFPFATAQFGSAHWSAYNVARWNAGHGPTGDTRERVEALGKQWLLNTGFGATAGAERERPTTAIEKRNIAHFGTEYGLPVFWGAALAGLLLALAAPPHRRFAAAAAVVLAVGVVFWLFFTHLQSRFLIPSLLPGTLLVGLAASRLGELMAQRMRVTQVAISVLFIAVLANLNFNNYFAQFLVIPDDNGEPRRIAPFDAAASLIPFRRADDPSLSGPGDHTLNQLPPGAKVLVVADNTRLLYVRPEMIYNSAFDDNPLGMLIRGGKPPSPAQLPPAVREWLETHPLPPGLAAAPPATEPATRPAAPAGPSIGARPMPAFDPVAVTNKLKAMGITHVWVHWSELDRLTETYGFDPDVNRDTIARLFTAGWRVTTQFPPLVTLYQIAEVPDPDAPPPQPHVETPREKRQRRRHATPPTAPTTVLPAPPAPTTQR